MKTLRAALILSIAAFGAHAQIITGINGVRSAFDYAYGWPGVAAQALAIAPNGGNAATGTATITLVTGQVSGINTAPFYPITTTTPIIVGIGANADTVTPTAVSGCNIPQPSNTPCLVTASFSHTHGPAEPVISGTYGLQEAINAANGGGGGYVAISSGWAALGGSASTVTSATAYSNVAIQNNGGVPNGPPYYPMQPTTLTSLAAPTTLTSSTVASGSACPTGASCTWTNSTVYACITLVDALGGEGPCSATYNFTATASVPVVFQAPLGTLTGAVGYRAYAGSSYNAAVLLPITSTNCTLTTGELVFPACALTSTASFNTIYTSTGAYKPNAQSPTVNLQNPLPQGHTTFGYLPSAVRPQVFQTHYGPFPAFGSLTAGQIANLGTVNLPTGFLNTLGRTIRFRGKLTTGSLNTATLPTLNVTLGWVGGYSSGAGTAVCTLEGVAAGATKTYNGSFQCQLDTNATGATAIGTVMPDGYMMLQAQDLSANGLGPYVDTNTTAVGSLGLFAQNAVSFVFTSTTNATAAPQLLSLDVDVLQ